MSTFSFSESDITERQNRIKKLEQQISLLRIELDALEKARAVLQKRAPANSAVEKQSQANGSKYGAIKRAVKDSFMVMPEIFSVRDVQNVVPDTDRASISSYLKEFSGDGTLKLVVEGRGRRPATYSVRK